MSGHDFSGWRNRRDDNLAWPHFGRRFFSCFRTLARRIVYRANAYPSNYIAVNESDNCLQCGHVITSVTSKKFMTDSSEYVANREQASSTVEHKLDSYACITARRNIRTIELRNYRNVLHRNNRIGSIEFAFDRGYSFLSERYFCGLRCFHNAWNLRITSWISNLKIPLFHVRCLFRWIAEVSIDPQFW